MNTLHTSANGTSSEKSFNGARGIGFTFYQASLKGEGTDVEFRLGKGPNPVILNAHKFILEIESNVFKTMLKDNCERIRPLEVIEGKTVIPLPEDDKDEFEVFLRYLYGFRPSSFERGDSLVIYKLSDKYEAFRVMEDFQEAFERILERTRASEHYNDITENILKLSEDYKIDILYFPLLDILKSKFWTVVRSGRFVSWRAWSEFTMLEVLGSNRISVEAGKFKKPKPIDWSKNEVGLFNCAVRWLENPNKHGIPRGYGCCGSKRRRAIDVDSALAVRILGKIRFRQMDKQAFLDCVPRLKELLKLTKKQEEQLRAWYDAPSQVVTKKMPFVPDTRLRDIDEESEDM